MTQSESILDFKNAKATIEKVWVELSEDYIKFDNLLNPKFMERRELSFHDHIKLLGYLSHELVNIDGDILEIGVWKGKSLALMQKLSRNNAQIIGIDPCEIKGQREELNYFYSNIFPSCRLIINYSHMAVPELLAMTKKIKLLHIDGGHLRMHVWLDFIIYSQFVTTGGFIVFDDYNDFKHSPEVKPAVDEMNQLGLFSNYEVIGKLGEYSNSFVLKKL